MPKLAAFITIIIIFSSHRAWSEEEPLNNGLIYGEGISYWVEAPPGWEIDNEAGEDMDIPAVFYPSGESWDDSETVMYTRTARKDSSAEGGLEKFIEEDRAAFVEHSTELTVLALSPLKTSDDKKVLVREFSSAQEMQKAEAVAYIDESDVVVVIVLSSKSEVSFHKSYPAFEKLVASYKRADVNVIINK